MITTATQEDLRELQKQINAIYEHLQHFPIHYATTREIAKILMPGPLPVDVYNLPRESKEIMDQFLD